MDESKIKEAFQKVKDDMNLLKNQLEAITTQLDDIKRTVRQTDKPSDTQTNGYSIKTIPYLTPTDTPTTPTLMEKLENKRPLESLKPENLDISTGNKGVPTDRQTYEQTDRQTDKYDYNSNSQQIATSQTNKFALIEKLDDPVLKIGRVAELVNSLDALKKDLRRQFKRLTPQEMLVFSTIYQLTDQAIDVDYTLLSKKTNLSESSIRDYIQKLLKKGIPLEKTRENNKRILLTISPEFKRIASLETLISLRGL